MPTNGNCWRNGRELTQLPSRLRSAAGILLLSEDGRSDRRIAKELDFNRHTWRLWRQRFASEGAEAYRKQGAPNETGRISREADGNPCPLHSMTSSTLAARECQTDGFGQPKLREAPGGRDANAGQDDAVPCSKAARMAAKTFTSHRLGEKSDAAL